MSAATRPCAGQRDGHHEWMDVTALGDKEIHEMCARCKARRTLKRPAGDPFP